MPPPARADSLPDNLSPPFHKQSYTHPPRLLQAVERELASREASFEDRHLAITLWSCGQLCHVPAAPALAPALEGLQRRLPAVDARTLVITVTGLADMQAAQRRRQAVAAAAGAAAQRAAAQAGKGAQTADEVWEGRRLAGVVAPAGAPAADSTAGCLVPPALLAALVDRACELRPRLQQFELAQLLRGFAELGSTAAADRLLRSPGPEGEALLVGAAQRDRLPSLVELLWAMAAWRCYPQSAFQPLAQRLGKVRSDYRFQQPTLALLGEALAAMQPQQRQQLRLRSGLVLAASGAARTAAAAAALGPAGQAGSGSAGSESDDQSVRQPSVGRHRQLKPAEGGPPPACRNANEECPVGSSLDEEPA